ncbi:MAG: hypothetical protein FWG73_09470 [Planctomycetaceae bacterium]|nr:hypothetical protein [Planctomycetaceae bacterium]
MKSANILNLFLTLLALAVTGCEVMPVTHYKPTLHNPFVGNMRSVAVVPFRNLTGNERVDGREFAEHFALELQRVPGFRVISNKIVEETMWEHEFHKIESVDDIRYLAQLLKVDVVVVGTIHNFNMSYPPHTKFETEWYHVNPYLHPIVEGYGLPWGTEHERFIPDKIVLLTEMNVAEAQIRTQTPAFEPIQPKRTAEDWDEYSNFQNLVPPKQARRDGAIRQMAATIPNNLRVESTDEENLSELAQRQQDLAIARALATTGVPYIREATPATAREQRDYIVRHNLEHPLKHGPWPSETAQENQLPWSSQNIYPTVQQHTVNPGGFVGNYPGMQPGMHPVPPGLVTEQLTEFGIVAQPIMPVPPMYPMMPGMPVEGHYGMIRGEPDRFPGLPGDWPDPRGLIPEGPKAERTVGQDKNEGPIISWINVYNGNDSEFMQALDDYVLLFRDDKRLSGKQTILSNRNEFIPFCCRMHIWEIFSARGGAGPAQKIMRTWKPWYGGERGY